MTRIIGIDTGTNSLGWAVVDRLSDGTYSLVKKGSLIFQEGVKIEKGNESSKAAERTGYRSIRRHYFRRRLRKIEVLKVLTRYGWCPPLSEEALHLWHVKKQYPLDDEFMAWQRTSDAEGKNPYFFRHRCLHEKLDLQKTEDRYTLGRALYHLAQRRGFLSNRLDQSDDKETGKVKESISDLSAQMQKNGCEFLGDYFYKLYAEKGNTERIRNRYTSREAHYRKEFDAICQMQELSDEQVRELERALYFQRPLKSQRHSVGKCTFEPRRPRCADSHPAYERFRMLTFINNVKVKGPYDYELRHLNENEIYLITPLFYRKSKKTFDFKEVAEKIAGKNKYQYIKDEGDLPYKFNYRMNQGVSGCPTTAQLREIFGDDFAHAIAEQYLLAGNKSPEEMVDDVWNVLYSFADQDYVQRWGAEKLQLNEEESLKFSKIKLSHDFAALSLCAIRKILPWLERGLKYSHAVMMAKIPDIVGHEVWESYRDTITAELLELIDGFNPKDNPTRDPLEALIKDYLYNNFELKPNSAERLYHPSMIETYPDAERNANGIYQLGSPQTNSVRNPMAMRSLHQVRKVINMLLRDGTIDRNTEVHIEYARELNDANKRAAIADFNKEREKKRKGYAEEIVRQYKEQTGIDIEPTEDDIRKYELWVEQEYICLYTGENIGVTDFVGTNPTYDIEHTIPRSVGGDSTMENLTLCQSRFNREVKRAKIPSELPAYDDILARLKPWRERIEKLRNDADRIRTHSSMTKDEKDRLIRKRHRIRLELDYWRGKYERFTMLQVPEGFSRRQGAGIGLVGRYAGLFLKSLFHGGKEGTGNVHVFKGITTAEYRKMWGIQDEYARKSRDNHIHHCIDAIVIACIAPGEYNATARYYQQLEEYERGDAQRPNYPKPWQTFTEDIKKLTSELLVVHDTPDNMPKQARKRIKTSHGIRIAQGDTARRALHQETYYGAIEHHGEECYVLRKKLSDLSASDVETIVDERVKAIVKAALAEDKNALSGTIYMNKEKNIPIKKVRCIVRCKSLLHIRQHRDASAKDYKRTFHVAVDGNYCMAVYEGIKNGKVKRTYEMVNTLDAANYFKKSASLKDYYPIAPEEKDGLKCRCLLRTGTHLILLQHDHEAINPQDTASLSKRLYYIAILQTNGIIVLRHHQEARTASLIKPERKAGAYKETDGYRSEISLALSNFHALVEGYDFTINAIGEVKLLRPFNPSIE